MYSIDFNSYFFPYIGCAMFYFKIKATKYSNLHQTSGRFSGKDVAHMQKSWT